MGLLFERFIICGRAAARSAGATAWTRRRGAVERQTSERVVQRVRQVWLGWHLACSIATRDVQSHRGRELMLAGEGLADPAAFLILRALSGSNGKVEIGGRRFAFSCIPT